jgi:hypothetical protein
MDKPNDPREEPRDAALPARRKWSTPEIVAYGHLAKLTRGSSGMWTEAGGMSPVMTCL